MKILSIFLLFPLLVLGQSSIKFFVSDETNIPIARSIIIITQNDNQITFGTTDEYGLLNKSLSNGNYQVKISKLGFISQTITVDLTSDKELNITLQVETNKLETIIIKSRPKVMRVKEDTISYNIKTVVDGTERKAEDVIKKLPGMNVDANGKVLYRGSEIDKVLIDGNEFFNNKHQMATQNIDAKMIEGIDLLTNYKGFSNQSGAGGTIALNLKLKDGYRNKFIGDGELSGGNNDAYRAHANIFKFSKTGNLSIITDFNTIAKTPITVSDYQEMRVPSDSDNTNNNISTFETPSFMEANAFFKRKNNGFTGVNYTKMFSKKVKVTASNIFNTTNIVQENLRSQTNLDNNSNVLRFRTDNKGTTTLNNLQVKLEYNKSKKNNIIYDLGFTPTSNIENENNVLPLNVIQSNISNANYSFFQTFVLKTSILNSIKYRFKIFNSFVSDDQSIALNTTEPLFNLNNLQLNQNQNARTNIFTIQNVFSQKIAKNTFTLKLNLNRIGNNLFLTDFENQPIVSNNNLIRNFAIADMSVNRNLTSKLNTIFGFKSTTNLMTFGNLSNIVTRNEPYFNVNYAISSFKKLGLSFLMNHEFPNLVQLQQNNILKDFQIFNTASNIKYDLLLKRKDFGLDYFWLSLKSQSILFTKLSYSLQDNFIANNTSFQTTFSQNKFIVTPQNKQFSAFALYDLKLDKYFISIKSSVFYFRNNGFNSFSNQLNEIESQNLNVKQQLFTNFKKSPIQFDIGYNVTRNQFSQGANNFSNTSFTNQLITTLRGKYKETLKWDAGLTRNFQNSGFQTNTLYFLNANVDYQISKRAKLILNGFNLLNMNESQIIRTSTNSIFFTESVNTILPGYAMFGVNYSF